MLDPVKFPAASKSVDTAHFTKAMAQLIRREFSQRPGFLPFKVAFVGGSFLTARAEGSMPIDLADAVSRMVFEQGSQMLKLERCGGDYAWHMGGTVITFRIQH